MSTAPAATAAAYPVHELIPQLVRLLGAQGVTLTGGEAYILFKPDLIDAQGNFTSDDTKKFLKGFLDQLAGLVAKHKN